MRARYVGISELRTIPQVAVVVDVMRAFTVAAWAFNLRAEKIILVGSAEEALALKAGHPDWIAVKDGPPAQGFDVVNSPGQLRAIDVTGCTLVQTTTFGTMGALAAKETPLLMCASFVVAGATAHLLRARRASEVTFIITGDGGEADEDLACADYIAQLAAGLKVKPDAFISRAARSAAAANLAEGVRRGYQGIHPDDVDLCLEVNRFPFAMTAREEDGRLTLRPRRVVT